MAVPVQLRIQSRAVLASMRILKGRVPKNVDVGVVYEAPYAVIVHETPRPPTSRNIAGGQGQWKYLETAARDEQVRATMRQRIDTALARKRSMQDALVDAAGVLLAASDARVPVITHTLRNSGKIVVLAS